MTKNWHIRRGIAERGMNEEGNCRAGHYTDGHFKMERGISKSQRGMSGRGIPGRTLNFSFIDPRTSSGDTNSAVPTRVAISPAKTRAHVAIWEGDTKTREEIDDFRNGIGRDWHCPLTKEPKS